MTPGPVLVAVNGPSSSGKTTFAARLTALLPRPAVVHTDDLAWHQGVLDWDSLLVTGIVQPVRAGRAVCYRPPAWDARWRPGAIEVPAGISHLVVEGVGVGRASLHDEFDLRIWVDTPYHPVGPGPGARRSRRDKSRRLRELDGRGRRALRRRPALETGRPGGRRAARPGRAGHPRPPRLVERLSRSYPPRALVEGAHTLAELVRGRTVAAEHWARLSRARRDPASDASGGAVDHRVAELFQGPAGRAGGQVGEQGARLQGASLDLGTSLVDGRVPAE